MLVLLRKGNRGSNECSCYMYRTLRIPCHQILVQGCFRDYKGTSVNEVQLNEFMKKPAPSVNSRENVIVISGPWDNDLSCIFLREEATWGSMGRYPEEND